MLGKEEIVSPNLEELKSHYHSIITLLGEDAEREGLLKTPERVAKAMLSLTKGYHMDPHEVLRSAKFQEEYSQMVIVKDIDFFSLCEHHMLPFYGKAHVAYIPNGYITGLSKIARVVDIFSHRLQVQERMTLQIKECIQETLNPLGVMVVVEAKHMCMQMRGVEKQNSITTTSDFTGAFNQAKTREEFMYPTRNNIIGEVAVKWIKLCSGINEKRYLVLIKEMLPVGGYRTYGDENNLSQYDSVSQTFCHNTLYPSQVIITYH